MDSHLLVCVRINLRQDTGAMRQRPLSPFRGLRHSRTGLDSVGLSGLTALTRLDRVGLGWTDLGSELRRRPPPVRQSSWPYAVDGRPASDNSSLTTDILSLIPPFYHTAASL